MWLGRVRGEESEVQDCELETELGELQRIMGNRGSWLNEFKALGLSWFLGDSEAVVFQLFLELG